MLLLSGKRKNTNKIKYHQNIKHTVKAFKYFLEVEVFLCDPGLLYKMFPAPTNPFYIYSLFPC